MLTQESLIKMALDQQPNQEEEHTPIRKAVDAVTNGATMAGGALVAGINSIKSIDNPAPVKQIPQA
jgi:hypothetical protein